MPRKAWLDVGVLSGILVGINVGFSFHELGWIEVNPSPYLLIPIMVGARYGTTAAFYTAAWTIAMIFGLTQFAEDALNLRDFATSHTYLIFSYFIFGILSGEIQEYFRRKAERFSFLYEESHDKLRKLDSDIRKIAQINNKLQKEVLTKDNQTFSLDIEIRGLYECPPEDLWIKTLLVLNRMERITNAAIYNLPKDGLLRRHALLGKEKNLHATLKLSEHQLLQKTLEEKQITALPEVLGNTSAEHEPFLFGMPLLDADGEPFALVVVAQMPFMSFNPRNLRRIALIANWASEILDLRLNEHPDHYRVLTGPENKRIFMPTYFRNKLHLSYQSFQQHEIPSSLILVHPKKNQILPQEELEQAVIKRVRTGDFAARIESKKPHVCVLLPFTAKRGGSIFVESCQGMIQGRYPNFPPLHFDIILLEDYTSFDALWKDLRKKLNHG